MPSKTAYVYLPYGYDDADTETRYDIIYLMHGWGGHAGEYFEYGTLKNTFDKGRVYAAEKPFNDAFFNSDSVIISRQAHNIRPGKNL
ncbi:MAG: hypothetical protein IJI57_05225 [Flexilinea sp.]|nr:hypothetical protein [Flexilinea sp.]